MSVKAPQTGSKWPSKSRYSVFEAPALLCSGGNSEVLKMPSGNRVLLGVMVGLIGGGALLKAGSSVP